MSSLHGVVAEVLALDVWRGLKEHFEKAPIAGATAAVQVAPTRGLLSDIKAVRLESGLALGQEKATMKDIDHGLRSRGLKRLAKEVA